MKDFNSTKCVYVDLVVYEFVTSSSTNIRSEPLLFNAAHNNPLKFRKKLVCGYASEYKPLFDILLNL